MIGSIISGVAQLGSTIYGGIKSGQYNKKAIAELENRRKENKQWYDMKSAQDYTQRSDVQNILRKQRELLEEQNKRAAATNIVAGGTDESLALQKQAAAETMGDTMADIASNATAYKDALENQYRSAEQGMSKEKQGIYHQQAQSVAQAAGQVGQAVAGMGAGIDNYLDANNINIFKKKNVEQKNN